jgi:predicted AlkP superfamily phosphohydrolase/phosphomutase
LRASRRAVRFSLAPVHFPAWSTCVTGVNPGRHGLFDFTELLPGRYGLRFTNAGDRRAPALWSILSAEGKRVGVLGVPGTYPPEPVNGFMVAGFDSPVATGIDASFVYPPALLPEVRAWRFADFQESHIDAGWHDRALPLLLAKVDEKAAIAEALYRKEPWDFFMVVFSESDTVAHHFWMFHDPASPRHRPGHDTAIRDVYARLDAAVGRLLEVAGDDVFVAVVSDHGFGGAGDGVLHLNNWLAEQGYLHFRAGGRSLLKEAALRFTPPSWRGRLFRAFRGVATRAESASRFGGIDWDRTTAWSEELNYFPSLRVNVAGREPHGQVPSAEYDQFVLELCARLEEWAPIRRAHPRAALYHGPYVERAPDIVIELALEDGYSHSCLRARGGPSFRRLRPEEHVGGKERGMNGNHRDTGVLLLSEPCQATSARLEDIAPTLLAVLGLEHPGLDGHALLDGPAGRQVEATAGASARPYTPEEEAAIEARLRDLGYFE